MHLFNLIADLRKKFMYNRSTFACLGSLTPSKFLGLYTATKTLENKTFQTIQSNRLSQHFFFFIYKCEASFLLWNCIMADRDFATQSNVSLQK